MLFCCLYFFFSFLLSLSFFWDKVQMGTDLILHIINHIPRKNRKHNKSNNNNNNINNGLRKIEKTEPSFESKWYHCHISSTTKTPHTTTLKHHNHISLIFIIHFSIFWSFILLSLLKLTSLLSCLGAKNLLFFCLRKFSVYIYEYTERKVKGNLKTITIKIIRMLIWAALWVLKISIYRTLWKIKEK